MSTPEAEDRNTQAPVTQARVFRIATPQKKDQVKMRKKTTPDTRFALFFLMVYACRDAEHVVGNFAEGIGQRRFLRPTRRDSQDEKLLRAETELASPVPARETASWEKILAQNGSHVDEKS
jgi:hypothetical protein